MRELDPTPAGIGRCYDCAYHDTGTPLICYKCAQRSFSSIPDRCCVICSLPLNPGETECRNIVCKDNFSQYFGPRYFTKCHAIALRDGILMEAINRYKFKGRKGWALIFGRIVAGYLQVNRNTFLQFDIIIPTPTYTGSGSHREWDHIKSILIQAAREVKHSTEQWPFDIRKPPLLDQTSEVQRFLPLKWKDRMNVATTELRAALRVNAPRAISSKRILVLDDVFTDGIRTNEIARALIRGGAKEVCSLVLARQPFRQKSS